MRDLIFKIGQAKISTIHYHLISWTIFITYEISLAAAIREKFNHFTDYLLHYILYILLFYIHSNLVLKSFKRNRRQSYWKVSGLVVTELGGYYYACVLVNDYLVSSGAPVNVFETGSRLFNLATIYRFFYILGLSTAYSIAVNFVKNLRRIHEFTTQTLIHEREKETLRAELSSSELAFLRSQINPHMLFNALTSIYNRIRKKDAISAEFLMALAELMQYSIKTKSPGDLVPIKSELQHIVNYLALQKLRYGCETIYETEIEEPELLISPLMLITLVENIFQHGELKVKESPPFIRISVLQGAVTMITENLIRPDPVPGNGVGLQNTAKRLELQYPDRYLLEYSADHNVFKLKLLIKIR